ncbi:MAG TPA: methionine biosynthesis protein MetW [Burkholderiales bacterium]|nr:methionine biosynthesis protein MetW [Burkholderiales bacterium]
MIAPLLGRADFAAIAGWVRPGARVLDLGCGDGTLLKHLAEQRGASGYGVEINRDDMLACIRRGVNVIQGDIERGLSDFADGSFDYVILSQTLQAVKNSEYVVREMLRVGRQGIVTFPNFGYWRNRLQVMLGRMPVSDNLPYNWYDTPNIHLCTVADFENFCAGHGVRILERIVIRDGGAVSLLPNLLGSLAVYRFERGEA